MTSRAVVKELYETGIEAPILRNWKPSSDSRFASTAVVKEIHVARGDGESCVAAGAHVVKIRHPEVRGDRCIAGAALVVELYRPTAGDVGVTGGGGVIEDHRAAGQAFDFGAASGAAATENEGAGARGAAEDFDVVSIASTLEINSTLVVVDLATASMAISESDCARAFILKVGAACSTAIKEDRSTEVRVVSGVVVASRAAAVEYQSPTRPYLNALYVRRVISNAETVKCKSSWSNKANADDVAR